MFSMVGSEGVGLLPVILPAADVRDIAQQAPEKPDHSQRLAYRSLGDRRRRRRAGALAIVAAAGSRTSTLRRLVIDTLAERLDSEVELQFFSVDLFPTVTVRGEGLSVRLRGHNHSEYRRC